MQQIIDTIRQKIEIRLKRRKEFHTVDFYDGVRVRPESLPEGSHLYHTRHSDTDMAFPVTILPEGQTCVVNFCGSIVTREPIDVTEETKLMWVSYL